MIKKSSTYISGFLAFVIYFTVIGLLIFYFNTRDEKKSKRYVKKDEHRIQVALSSPRKTLNEKKTKPKAVKKKVQPKKKIKPKVKPKPKKEIKKKVIKEKVVKKVVKKKDENLSKPKKVTKPKDLFANISPTKKPKPKLKLEVTDKPIKPKKSNLIKVSDKPSASNLVSNSLKMQKQMDSGVADEYLAKVQSLLEGWPAQSEYAGEKVKVILYINPTGFFEFKVKSASNNPDFNDGLTEYLEQLQEFGFGRHKGNRTYNFEAEFIAKE
ncbi:MAG: hypothetical protein DRG09_01995 [Epsilonproteobacteria bacterium]|nr:MAG: hypothetical protein DRG09_01995 [Campylobacterota bacterium]